MPSDKIEQSLVDELLALEAHERQSDFLRASGLLNAEGIGRLLDVAERLARDDPGKTRRLALLCSGVASEAGAPAALPRANYIRAQMHAADGDFDEALRLTKVAQDGYLGLGMELEALRTNVGKMAALLDLGRYEEALEAGRVVLEALSDEGKLKTVPTREESDLLAALVYQNIGGCHEYRGRYDEALDAYATAEERYRALGMPERVGEVLDNRGAILSVLGRGSDALAAHETAAAIFEASGLTLSHGMSLGNIGETHLRLANYTQGLDTFERARRLLSSFDTTADEGLLLRDTAGAYLGLNLYREALAAYRDADDLLRSSGMTYDRAVALWGMGSALVALEECEEAEESLAGAAALFEEAGNTTMLSGVMLEMASLQAVRGDLGEALTTAQRVLDLLAGADRPVQQTYAHLRLADLLTDLDEVEWHLLQARRLADPLGLPQLRYRLNERLGRLRLLQGRNEEARVLLEAAVEEIEHLRDTVAQETMRASFLRDKTAAYEDLLCLHLGRDGGGDAQAAFVVAERAKSRALVDLLTGVAKKRPDAAKDPELAARLQELQADLNATYSLMLGGATNGRGVALQDLHDRAVVLEAEIGRLRLQSTNASSDPFATPEVALEDVSERIPSDVALLAYHVVGDEILAFVVAGGGVRVARRLGTVSAVRRLSRKLAVQWDRFRAGREFAGRHAALLERSARQILAALHGELMAPLEPLLETGFHSPNETGRTRRIVVVPHGPLHQVPFHALFDGERYLLERLEVSYAPSATVYALCQERTSQGSGRALAFGVEDPSIPAAATEARAVAECIPGAQARVGEQATLAALREQVPGCDILHLACHGLFRADNPMFSSLKLHDGWLTAADAIDLDLPGALVTLSACESGRGEVIGGDEVLGLTRAFLGAGAATLVVSLWLAQDETTAELMGNWYERLRGGMGRAAALRAAQLEVRERYPHPYYWAPFVLIGER